jgi:predicted aldo/keto reductase-like oxidoreductase
LSEIIPGKAVKPFREKIRLSTKNPIQNACGDDYDRRLERSLKQLDTDYIDFYHFWGITLDTFINKICVPDGPLDRVKKWKAQGVVKYISFSFHDAPENEAVELIVFGKEYIPFAGFYHSITITLRQARCSRFFATPPSALSP